MSNKKLKDFINNNTKGDVGVEIEVESNSPLPTVVNNRWLVINDNSLRNNGKEYVFSSPLPLEDATKEFKILYDLLKPCKVKENCIRTSVHVHMNMLDYDIVQIWTAIFGMWIVEDLLAEFAGPNRKGNLFCLRVSDAEHITKLADSAIKSKGRLFRGFSNDFTKYSALNLANLVSLGTLENRMMRGTINPEVLTLWTSNLHSIKENSINNFKTPEDIMDSYWVLDNEEFLRKLLSPEFMEFVLTIKDWKSILADSAYCVMSAAYGHNWKEVQASMEKAYFNTYNPVNTINFDEFAGIEPINFNGIRVGT